MLSDSQNIKINIFDGERQIKIHFRDNYKKDLLPNDHV